MSAQGTAVGCHSALVDDRQTHPHNMEPEQRGRIYVKGSNFLVLLKQDKFDIHFSVFHFLDPAPVPDARVVTATTTSISFTWDPAPGDKNSYEISYIDQIGGAKLISSALTPQVTESGLALATHYEFNIVTISAGLRSEPFVFVAATRKSN